MRERHGAHQEPIGKIRTIIPEPQYATELKASIALIAVEDASVNLDAAPGCISPKMLCAHIKP
jgi:hypothetical protein